jgi:hypothetical protein
MNEQERERVSDNSRNQIPRLASRRNILYFVHWLRNSHIYGTVYIKDHNTLPVVTWNKFTELYSNIYEQYYTLYEPRY